jgi:hypothetical protein
MVFKVLLLEGVQRRLRRERPRAQQTENRQG